ncbi:MAG TPA: S9 family peptidase [Thermoanaerobaculia bacterium]|nr:S9 family peptidase [Thermoanaerobaculia bacterium]
MTKPLLRILLILFVAASAAAAEKPALTHEAMWAMKRVGPPVPSPDGRWVVFSMTDPAYDEKDQTSDLWLAPADAGAKPRQITFTKASESGATWSPDSRRIAFSARREGDDQAQIYVLDIAGGGEARRVTSLSTGARSPQFRPDGGALLFVSSAFRGASDDEANKKAAREAKERKTSVRVYESFPIRNWDRWLEPERQPQLFVQPLPDGNARSLLAGTKLIAGPGFSGQLGNAGESITAAWSPDGQWVVFAATTQRNAAAYSQVSNQLYRVKTDGGEPESIAGGDGSYGNLTFSPDGRTLYATFNPNNGQIYNLTRLVAYDWPSMRNRRLLTGPPFDRGIGSYAVTADSRTIYFTAEDAGLEKIYSVPATGGTPSLAVEPERGVYTNLEIASRAPGLVMVGLWGSSVDPAEVVRIDPARRTRRNLTDFNVASAAAIDWQPPRHFWFTNKDGQRVHNMIVLPPGFDPKRKYPVFVLMHGGPFNMWRDQISLRWNYHLLGRPGYVMLMTNYRGSTGFGEAFARSIGGDPLRGPADDINQGADEAIRRFPFIDGSRQVAGGASYGGHLANWLQATTTRYKALISHAGLINMESQWGTSDTIYHRELMAGGPVWEQGAVWREQNPIRYAANFKTPMLLSVGEKDYRVPLNQTLENWSVLQRQRVPSKLLVWPEENHWILSGENSRFFYQQVWEWIDRWIGT